MEISLHQPKSALIVESYGTEGFRISGENHSGPIMLTAEASAPWPVGQCLDQAAYMAAASFMAGCEVVLVGSGSRTQFIAPSQRLALKAAGLNLEVMDTGAACRTYNVLLGDGRKVGALLLPEAQPQS